MSEMSDKESAASAISKLEELAADLDVSLEMTAGMSLEAVEEDLRRMGLDPNQGLPREIKQLISRNVAKRAAPNTSTVHASQVLEQSGSINALGWVTLNSLFALFTKLRVPAQLLLGAAGLTVALYYGNTLRFSLLDTNRSVAMALATKSEPMRTTGQGISTFLLSGVQEDWAKTEYLNLPELNSILQDINAKVQEVAAGEKSEEAGRRTGSRGVLPQATPPTVTGVINRLNLKVVNTGSTEPWRTAITSTRKESFMVVPAMSLRRKTLEEPPLAPNDPSRLAAVLEHNPEILFDLNLASELEPIMRRMDNASGERLTIAQTYFITEAGVFLIRANGVKDQGDYYKDEFQPYTQYLDQSYFWGAVDSRPRQFTPFDYVTKPYLDFGGNGFVVTFSKKFDLPNQRVGVLCVDAKLPDEVTDEIEKHLKSLGAQVSEFYWSENKGIEPGKQGPLPPGFDWFSDLLNKSFEARSQVLGTIATEPPITSSALPRGEADDVVRFTVPVSSGEYGEGIKRIRLLSVEFDSAKIQKNLIRNLVFFTAGIILMIVATWSLFRDYIALKRESRNTLEKMTMLMRDASTPFLWLNEKNEFVKVNKSMLEVLGCMNLEELRKHSPTFRGLLTVEAQSRYEEILKISAAGQETWEYEIDVITKTGKVLHIRAYGERIPYPSWWRRSVPHRFGIFVEVVERAATI